MHRKFLSKRSYLTRSIAAFFILTAAPAAQAATWNLFTAGPHDWDNNANWSTPATFVNAVGDTALMNGNLSAGQTVNLNQSITLGALTVGDISGTQTTLLQKGTSGALIFDQTGSGDALLTRTQTGTGAVTFASDLTVLLNDNLVVSLVSGAANSTMNINGVISSAAGKGITKNSNTLTLVLAGANDYTGLTTVNGGVLSITNASALGTNGVGEGTSVVSGGQLEIANGVTSNENITIDGGGSLFFGALRAGAGGGTWAGSVTLNGTATRIGATAANTLTITGSIGNGTGNSFIVSGESGTGVVIINPTTSNTYTGNTGILRGILKLGKNDALPTGTVLDIDTTNGVSEVATLDLAGFNQTVGGLQDTATTNINGLITNSVASTTSTLTVNQTSNTDFAGVIQSGAGTVALVKSGVGNLTLTGANTFTGKTLVSDGKITLNNTLALQNSAYDSASVNGGLDVTGFATPTLGGLTGSVNLSSALITGYSSISDLKLNPQTGFSQTYSGDVGNGNGSMSLTKTGAGTQILQGNNSYTGATTVSAGILNIQHASALGTAAGGTTVSSGASLQMQAGITVASEALNLINSASGVSALDNLSGNNAWNGAINVTGSATNNHVVRVHSTEGTLTLGGTVTLGVTTANANNQFVMQGDGNFLVSGQLTGASAVTSGATGTGTRTLSNAANDYTGNTNVNGGTLQAGVDNAIPFGAGKGNLTFNGGVFDLNGYDVSINGLASGTPSVGTIANNATGTNKTLTLGNNNATASFSGVIANNTSGTGTVALIKTGTGTQTLSGVNTYTGTTTVSAGTLVVTGSLANNNFDKVSIAAPDDTLTGNPILTRATPGSYAGIGSTVVGGLNSTAEILNGTNSSGTDTSLSMQWRLRTANESTSLTSPPLPNTASPLLSEVLSLTGMGNGGAPVDGYVQTDPFVLQMSYDETLVHHENQTYLATFDTTTGYWVNAVAGNFTGTASVAPFERPYDAGIDGLLVGRWGFDATNNVVWAIIDHNSEFAAVPEPSTLVFGGLALLGFAGVGLRKRRMAKSQA